MKKTLFLTAITLSLFACKSETKNISQFSWLQGNWEGQADSAQMTERWNAAEGTSMSGHGTVVAGTDTVFSEKMKIEQRGADLFYVVTVNEGTVEFKFTGEKNDSIVFENPQHDFPQRIIYFKQPGDKMYACIDGRIEGKYNREEFFYTKAK